MANQLYAYNFPDAYATLVSNYTGTVKYIAAGGSNANNGDTVSTPYLTIDYAITQNSAASRVMFVVLAGTYTMTAVTGTSASASVAVRDGGNERVYVCCPSQTIIQWTANTGDRDCCMIDFGNTASAIYGATLKRNNNARSGSYVVAYFRMTTKGNLYNCVLQETNANNSWSYQYDNYGYNNLAVRNCTVYNGAAPAGNYSNAGTCLTIDTVFNTTCTTGGTETNVLKSQTVNSSTYVTTGVTTAGVYSGTYAWNGAMTIPLGLSSSNATFPSGAATSIILTTSGLTNGTLVPYTITGVTSAQISGASLTGNFTINNNTSTISITPLKSIISASLSISASTYSATYPIAYPVAFSTYVGRSPTSLLLTAAPLTLLPSTMDRVALAATSGALLDLTNNQKTLINSTRTSTKTGSTAISATTNVTTDTNAVQKTVSTSMINAQSGGILGPRSNTVSTMSGGVLNTYIIQPGGAKQIQEFWL